jgi:REP element-mobilizing transposase RayT
MPRGPRLDAPGVLHHVMARGIERREIFEDDADRQAFVVRLEGALRHTGGAVYAWCVLPNHVHLLVRSGWATVGRMMQSLLGGYAGAFNRRHRRSGHLFQNRFKSVLVEEDAYLLELVRYIHLNPVRAGLVAAGGALDRYPWTGHAPSSQGRRQHKKVRCGRILERARGASPKNTAKRCTPLIRVTALPADGHCEDSELPV